MQLKRSKSILFFIFALLAFTPKTMQSQTVLLDPAEIYVGVSGGATGSMMLFTPTVQQSYFLGYNGGIAARYITENHVGLQVEFNYSQRGWLEANDLYSRQLDYIEMPFLTHIYFGKTNRFIFNLGPKIAYLLDEKVVLNNAENSKAEQHIKPVYSKFDYGIAAGLGYNLKTKNIGVYQLELRAYYGLSDIFANTKKDFFDTSNHLNVSLNFGYFFQLTGRGK